MQWAARGGTVAPLTSTCEHCHHVKAYDRLTPLRSCGHRFCAGCLRKYFVDCVARREPHNIKCRVCGVAIEESDVR
jgi:hypothetical protein